MTKETKALRSSDVIARELRDLGCGQVLGRYTLLRRIASGGMAEVYVARSSAVTGVEKRVAIKKILPSNAQNERFIKMLVDEAKICVALAHPNVAQVYELGVDGDYFIVMEWVDGPPLSRVLARANEQGEGLPAHLAAHIICEVAKGLEHAHRKSDAKGVPLDIVHRDISPQNVLCGYSGDVKIIDFGIARAAGRSGRTAHGMIKGKLRYLAPEIACGREPDHRADIFCAGLVLFELLTGQAVYQPSSEVEALAMAQEAAVRSPRSVNPRVPEELEAIVLRALAKDREQRYQSARELAADLKLYLNQKHPSFVDGDLSDFLQAKFREEIEAERRIDALAEMWLKQWGASSLEQPTALDIRVSRPDYRRLVSGVGTQGSLGASSEVSRDAEPRVDAGARTPPRAGESLLTVLSVPVTETPPLSDFYEDDDASSPWSPKTEAEEPAISLSAVLGSRAGKAVSPADASRSRQDNGSRAGKAVSSGGSPEEARTFSSEMDTAFDADVVGTEPQVEALRRNVSMEITEWRPRRFAFLRGRPRVGGAAKGDETSRYLWVMAFCLLCAFASLVLGGMQYWDSSQPRTSAIVAPPDTVQAVVAPVSPPPIAKASAGDTVPEPTVDEEGTTLNDQDDEDDQRGERRKRRNRRGLYPLRVSSLPAADIFMDGKKVGRTPKVLRLSRGYYSIELRGPRGDTRSFPRFVGPGRSVAINQHW